MQNDFVSGALGTPEARRIVPAAAERVAAGIRRGADFLHPGHPWGGLSPYPGGAEPACTPLHPGTEGWEIVEQLRPASAGQAILDKPSFGSAELGRLLAEEK